MARCRSVSVIGSLPPVKGVSAYTTGLLDALDRRGDLEVDFVGFRSIYPRWFYPGGDPDEPSGRPPLFLGVKLRATLRWYNPFSWAWAGLRMRGEVVHAQWWSYALAPVYATLLGIARLRGKRVVMTAHNVQPHEGGFLQRLAHRAVFRFAHSYVVHSEANKAALLRMLRCDPARISVLPHGVLETPRSGLSRREARLKLGIDANARVALCFGNIRPYKGVDVLLRAFAEVAREDPGALLIIAGQPWGDWAPYQRLIDELNLNDRVLLRLEYIAANEIEQYFVAADAVVLPYTHFDAQSGVGMRALPFGRPLIVTNTGGLPDLVLDRRAVVPPGDAVALAGVLRQVLGDQALRDRMAVDSLALAASMGWDAIAERTVEIYAAARAGVPAAAWTQEPEPRAATGAPGS
ncbi:MAG: glycosyltransferase family 4 protein [Chloroflexi bacterium]|nr:glycosyltransferase family 4 protein [Chloroflexota bacterium]